MGYGYTVGGPIDPDKEGNSEVEALPNVTWNLPKDELVALLKRHLPKMRSAVGLSIIRSLLSKSAIA